ATSSSSTLSAISCGSRSSGNCSVICGLLDSPSRSIWGGLAPPHGPPKRLCHGSGLSLLQGRSTVPETGGEVLMEGPRGALGLDGVRAGLDHADGGRVGGLAEGEQGRPPGRSLRLV